MTGRLKRFAYRASEVLDYRTFVVATGFLSLMLVGFIVVASLQRAHEATQSADQRGRAASRRIDLLNTEIKELQAEIAAGRDERGQLAASVAALAAQIRQLGGQPVVMVTPGTTIIVRPSAAPTPTPGRSTAPRPTAHPTATRTPSPSPSPSCTRLLILPC